jgi:predicted phage terminase large subunit-like protein
LIDAAGRDYVDAWLHREPPDAQIARGITLALTPIGIEHSAFQSMMHAEWNRQAAAAGLVLPVHGIGDRGVKKEVRIRTLGPLLAQRRVYFNPASVGARELVNQLRDFPIGDHDDGPDALEMAYRLAADLGVKLPAMPSRLPLETERLP